MAEHALDLGEELLDEEEIAKAPPPPPLGMLGGARADFVAALGRRVAELTSLARQLEADPGSERLQGDLRRRIHALAAGARLLRFTRLSERLGTGEALLLDAAGRGVASPGEISALRATFEQVPALAWGEVAVGESTTPSPARAGQAVTSVRARPVLDPVNFPLAVDDPAPEPPPSPQTALVIGADRIAEALALEGGEPRFEVERARDGKGAVDLARALAPDVVVLDADRPGAHALCEALVSDPITEAIPVVVVGHWARADEAAPFAAVGAARTLAKPASPDAIRRACIEAVTTHRRRDVERTPLGDTSVEDLSARLCRELYRGLCDATVAQSKGARFDLGEGSEVLAALWGAIARIRDVVTIQSSGGVRFVPSGPEGALPIAPWLGAAHRARPEDEGRSSARSEAREGAASLDRKVVVVADDDPAVTWFLAGVLRATGAVVHEAHDGAAALDAAHRVTPDLVITDVVMPVLDGFALCRALKRDIVLRDVPVILLSWKEDLLQRVRELGGGADGYLRKEASAPVIVQRAREVLRPRSRVEERLAQGGEVRGRLDGLTTRTLLGLSCAVRPDATLTVRDTSFLYEIDLRAGRPVRASRTSNDGVFERGAHVLAALLGVGAGRFVVSPPPAETIAGELDGCLDEQLLPHLAVARAAQRLLSGAALVTVELVELDPQRMAGYADATPEPARTLLRTLAAGASPRALITSGQAAARLLEDVLADAAAHGAVTAVIGANGDDLLAPAIEREIDVLRGAKAERPPVIVPELDLGPVIATSTPAPVEIIDASRDSAAAPQPSPAPPAPGATAAPALRREESPAPASLPPLELPVLAAEAKVVPESRPAPRSKPPLLTLGSLTPPPVAPAPVPVPVAHATPPAPVAKPRISAPVVPVITSLDETPSRTVRKPSSFVTPEPPPKPEPARNREPKDTAKPSRSMWGLFAVAGIVFAVGARLSRERELGRNALPPVPSTPVAEARAPEPTPEAPPPAELRGEGASKVDPILPQEGPLRADDKVPAGQGMLEVVAGTSDTIWIDGTLVGNGPLVKRALAPKKEPYEIRVRLRGEERVRFARVQEARLTRLRIAPPWSR